MKPIPKPATTKVGASSVKSQTGCSKKWERLDKNLKQAPFQYLYFIDKGLTFKAFFAIIRAL